MSLPAASLTSLPTGRGSGRRKRRTLTLAAICTAFVLAWFFVPPLWDRATLLYWQHRCATHRPAGQPLPNELVQYGRIPTPPVVRSWGVLFLHELVSPSGNHRVVAVNLEGQHPADYIYDGLPKGPLLDPALDPTMNNSTCIVRTWVMVPAGCVSTPPNATSVSDYLQVSTRQPIPFDTGQVDPKDPAHFWITTGPGTEIIDGWLQSDDTVRLQVRAMPAARIQGR